MRRPDRILDPGAPVDRDRWSRKHVRDAMKCAEVEHCARETTEAER